MRILVTGAAGFIGAALCGRLLDRGDQVFAVDNLNDYYEVSLKLARLVRLQKNDSFTFHQIDVADRAAMESLFAEHKFEMVMHLAAQAGVRYSLENPSAYIDSNLVGFGNILEGCRHNDVQHLVYASSSSVYGGNTTLPFSENHVVDRPVSLYAATKKSNEMMAHAYAHLYNLRCTGLRFFTVYGPWGRPDMAFFKFTDLMLKGQPIPVYNHGKLTRDFTYIDDIVEGVLSVLDKPAVNAEPVEPPFKIYNLGCGKRIQLMDYIHALENALGVKAEYEMMPMQAGDVSDTNADMSHMMEDFNFQPSISIEHGLAAFAEWYRDYYDIPQ